MQEKALTEQMRSIDSIVSRASDAIDRSLSMVNYSNDLELVSGTLPMRPPRLSCCCGICSTAGS